MHAQCPSTARLETPCTDSRHFTHVPLGACRHVPVWVTSNGSVMGDGHQVEQCNAGHEWRPRLLVALSPIHVWLAATTALPHKEERFLYVVYPLVGLLPFHMVNTKALEASYREVVHVYDVGAGRRRSRDHLLHPGHHRTIATKWHICLSVMLTAEYLGICCVRLAIAALCLHACRCSSHVQSLPNTAWGVAHH